MVNLHFNKLYSFDRKSEYTFLSVPFEKGKIKNTSDITVKNSDKADVPCDVTPLSFWDDGSLKWGKIDFLADLKGNAACDYSLELGDSLKGTPIAEEKDDSIFISTGCLSLQISKSSGKIFELLTYNKRYLSTKDLKGPVLIDAYGRNYMYNVKNVTLLNAGNVCASVKLEGEHTYNENVFFTFSLVITAFAGKPDLNFSYELKNVTDSPIQVQSLSFSFNPAYEPEVCTNTIVLTGSKGVTLKATDEEAITYEINKEVADSIYDSQLPETYMGTFFADYTDEALGVCATVKNALQNYPKTFSADKKGLNIYLIPKTPVKVILNPNLKKSFDFNLHFHGFDAEFDECYKNAVTYEFSDKPVLSKEYIESTNIYDSLKFNDDTAGKVYTLKRTLGVNTFGSDFDSSELLSILENYYTGSERVFLEAFMCNTKHLLETTDMTSKDFVSSVSFDMVDTLLSYYHMSGNADALNNAAFICDTLSQNDGKSMFAVTLHSLISLYNETHKQEYLEAAKSTSAKIKKWYDENSALLLPYEDIALVRFPHIILLTAMALTEYASLTQDADILNLSSLIEADLNENCVLSNGAYCECDFPSRSYPMR